MATRRMFSLDVVNTDLFLDMPVSAQCLYFHLGMRADDDGFIASPKQIMRMATCTQDDMKILVSKGFVIPFESGIVVIRHWKQHNYIQSDRYRKTKYTEEKDRLELKDNVYVLDTERIQSSSKADTQYRLSKDIVRDRDNNYSVHFESFWNAYPRKKEKAKAYKCYNARLNDGYSEEELLTAATEYAKECKERKTEERYIKLGSTFLSASTPFVDYLKKEGDKSEAEERRRPAADFYEQYMS
ncbi:hypothetical protein ACQRAS_00250 [Coprococcus catus]